MSAPKALIDTNVLIAAADAAHGHHGPSIAFLTSRPAGTFAVAAHALAETYSTLTRRNLAAPFHWSPEEALAAVERFAARVVLVGLTPAQTLDAIRGYAEAGGVGPRLYDRLIGQTAALNGVPKIVTWNVGHMRALFPALQVEEPPQAG